jgi:hypothetical protein
LQSPPQRTGFYALVSAVCALPFAEQFATLGFGQFLVMAAQEFNVI